MALETRKPGGPKYAYHSRCDPATGKVRKVYLGSGPKADAAEAEFDARWKRRAAERQAVERAGVELRPAEALMAALNEGATLLMEAALLAANWHRRNYGPWRRRRTEMTTDGTEPPSPPDPSTELRAVVARAKAGDVTALPRLRVILDANPALVRHYGDLARQAEGAWVALAAGSNLYLKESALRAAEAQRADLTRPGAQPVEKLLVERVVACGLQVQYFSATEASALAAGDTHRQLQFHAKRLGQAQRMYLTALGALVTYQKLMPADVGVAAEPAVLSDAHEPQLPARAHHNPQPQVRLAVEVDADSYEPTREERERVHVGAGG